MHSGVVDDFDLEAIEACRTCGIYFAKTMNLLQPLFCAPTDDPHMLQIRKELSSWNIEINPNDGRPQYICQVCIGQFDNYFKFRRTCIETQAQFSVLEFQRTNNINITIKTELPDPDEQKLCGFIYIDDDDDDDDNDENFKNNEQCYNGSFQRLNIPYMPIKEEHSRQAKVSSELAIKPTINNLESMPLLLRSTQTDETRSKACLEIEQTEIEDIETNKIEAVHQLDNDNDNDSDIEIIKFSYTDDADETELNSQQITCQLCLHVSNDKIAHRQHMQRIHEIKDLACHICNKSFKNSTSARLKFHIRWHKLNKHIKCAQCGFFCATKDTLGEHMRAVHSRIKCNICSKSVHAKRMKMHLRRHQCQESIDNSVQHVSSSSALSLEQHKPNNKTIDEFQTDEPINALTLHNSSMDEVKLKEKTKSIDLPVESENVTVAESVTQFTCATCKQTFKNIRQFTLHLEIHTRQSLNCHICGKKFNLKFKLNRHLSKHTDETS